MSFSFLRRLRGAVNIIFDDKAVRNIPPLEINLKICVFSTILLGHGVYAFTTVKNDSIIVDKKYKMNRNGFTDFMIVDDKGRHFNVNNSLWYWKWDSVEDWHKIQEKNELYIKYYGWRWPVFGLFPNIVISDKAQFLDSISRADFIRFECEATKHIAKLC